MAARAILASVHAALLSAAALGCASPEASRRDPQPPPLYLRVDFAAPAGPGRLEPDPRTARAGWWPWVLPDWDLYRLDLTWEDGSQEFPASGPGIARSGVHAAVSTHCEGLLTLHVAGMRRYLAGGVRPEKAPIYDPIANTWVAASDFPDNPGSDVILVFYGLPPGRYRLLSYHNRFNCRRIGDEPTGVECAETGAPEPPLRAIRVYGLEALIRDYFHSSGSPRDESQSAAPPSEEASGGAHCSTSLPKLVLPGYESATGVEEILAAFDVPIQQTGRDEELVPSLVEFRTDGSPVAIVYAAGCCKADDLRPHRRGGYAVLNAFELVELREGEAR